LIHRAAWARPGHADTPVAVKLYKGEMTSDGSPLHEMNACITAGLHPNLIRVEGRVVDHPQDTAGLVMQLIDPSYRNLAALPSLATCSRDVRRRYPLQADVACALPGHRLGRRALAPPGHHPWRPLRPQYSVERAG
jgi:hypothetical protein